MATEGTTSQTLLVQLKTAAADQVPSPGDGPILFGDAANGGQLTVKLTDGTTHVVTFLPGGAPPEVEGDAADNEALMNLLTALAGIGLIVDSTT